MYQLGIDLGSASVKLALFQNGIVIQTWLCVHHGQIAKTLQEGLTALNLPQTPIAVAVTGSNRSGVCHLLPNCPQLDEIPAITEGVRFLAPQAKSAIEIGSQAARFLTHLEQPVPRFAVNEHCAGGTGSFFEDQMSRLGLQIEDYSTLVAQATSIPRLSGRCAVFAKTDIIHRQQEGASTPDILLGLCYAMIRNYKATIVRNLPVEHPIAFCGGVTCNTGVIRAIREIFQLSEEELMIPEHAQFAAAIGAAQKATGNILLSDVLEELKKSHAQTSLSSLPPLRLAEATCLQNPPVTGTPPADGCALGIDIGSTSTDLVLTDKDGNIVDFQYLRTAGDPEKAVRQGLQSIASRFGDLNIRAVGVTGSGRERIGRLVGADAVRDEITAQAKAACFWQPETDTVMEIGGQDSKFIVLKNGHVTDFQMNKICAAGTGSFVEEQAARMNLPIDEFGPLALTADAPADLGERCTVFIETAIASATAEGVSPANIAAGLCHSIVRNYTHKVIGGKPVGQHIVLQGGVAYNPGIVAAFQQQFGERLTVSPYFAISGAFGAALLAMEAVGEKSSCFRGFAVPQTLSETTVSDDTVAANSNFYRKAGALLLDGYTGERDPNKKTVGIPFALLIHKFFPMANAFFKSLGFNVLLSTPSNEDTIRRAQQLSQGEPCYPVKLIYGHMQELVEKKVDYIFLPSVHTMKHDTSHAKYNYGCVYMQTAPHIVADALHLEEKGIPLLSPVFDLDFGKEAMATAMLSMGKILGISKPRCMKALLAGAMAVRRHTELVEQQGKALLGTLKPEDKVLVLITRNYGISDPILNMGIPQLLLERGHKVITLSHLPGHDLDISQDYPNLYWPFGQHILSGAKMIANHPNLYAVYLTNHGCGPDSILSHFFQQEMGEKPYLQIEVDEHFSKIGVITRIEAFLNSLSSRPAKPLPKDFQLTAVVSHTPCLTEQPRTDRTLYLPDLGYYTSYLQAYFQVMGIAALALPPITQEQLQLGRSETNAKELLPFAALTGIALDTVKKTAEPIQFLLPSNLGSEADGQYARGVCAILQKHNLEQHSVFAPILEELPKTAFDLELLFRCLVTGDLLYAAPPEKRQQLAPQELPTWEALLSLANTLGQMPTATRTLGIVGTPLCQTVLQESVLDTLEAEGNHLIRAPLSEAMLFLWQEYEEINRNQKALLKTLSQRLLEISARLGDRTPFSADMNALHSAADDPLPRFAGGNGRYRWAKAMELGARTSAILTAAPRYENTATILELHGLEEACPAPMFSLAFDGDWDETAWSRLRSFLYYC